MIPITTSEDSLAESGLLSNLGKSLSVVLDLPELLAKVTEAAISLTHASEGSIILEDPESGLLNVYPSSPPDANPASQQPPDGLLAAHVLATSEPLIVNEGQSFPPPFQTVDSPRPMMYTPLITKGRTIGVLIVKGDEGSHPFSRHDLDMLVGLGGYAGIAVENARLYTQAVGRSLELGLLVESANAFSWSLDLSKVLQAIARHLMRSLDAHWCIVSAWDQQSAALSRLAEYRLAYWTKAAGHVPRSSDSSFYASILKDGKFMTQYRDSTTLDQGDYSRLLAIPLQTDGRVVGLAELCSIHNRAQFSSDQITRSLSAAQSLAQLIHKGNLSQSKLIMLEAARTLLAMADTDFCTIHRYDRVAESLERLADYGTGLWLEESGATLNITQFPTSSVVVTEQRTAVMQSADPEIWRAEQALYEQVGPSTLLLIPLVIKTKTIGVVQLYDLNPARVFTSRELGVAQALANQAAIALENARLVRDLQRSLDEQKEMQGRLVRAARLSALGELTAVIAHQINNPLTTIIGDAEILGQDLDPEDSLRESALAIRRAGERAKKVVERMLGMARNEVDVRPVDVNKSIQDTLELVGVPVARQRIKIVTELVPDLPFVSAIPGQLEDVWMNLILNARDAIRPEKLNGRICIRSRLTDDGTMVEVTVEDNGDGIAAADLERIFDPMFTSKPAGKGTGLGLYICRQIATDHGGQIDVQSQQELGTTVRVRLPHISQPQGR